MPMDLVPPQLDLIGRYSSISHLRSENLKPFLPLVKIKKAGFQAPLLSLQPIFVLLWCGVPLISLFSHFVIKQNTCACPLKSGLLATPFIAEHKMSVRKSSTSKFETMVVRRQSVHCYFGV